MTHRNVRPGAESRAVAAQAVFQVVEQGRSLSQALPSLNKHLEPRDKGMAQALAYGTLRYLPALNFMVGELISKPLKGELKILHSLLLVGAYQLVYMGSAEHAAVSATVDAAVLLKRGKQKGLVNGVLRNLQRQLPELQQQLARKPALLHNHPRWLSDLITQHYPAQAEAIFTANNGQAPMWLRINSRYTNRAEYLQLLSDAGIEAITEAPLETAIQLVQAVDVQQLPHFQDGWVSVQDIAAQHAAWLLNAQAGERILDCCAAPGGKTAHILEQQPEAQVLAIDADAPRLQRVHDNLKRLKLNAEVRQADATNTEWWNGQLFDRILLDAPCSATGVIRRHPDIKWLRRDSDIAELVHIQQQILNALWPTLKPGGTLLYATCSILAEENTSQIEAFKQAHSDAIAVATKPDGAVEWQWLPGDNNGDGFYYAKLEKRK
ncbi:16S rRNA m(5)C-967 methyltransferase [Pseudidiomarina maritima]|uniref:16S rRNA (cytosine(967)-C(5))-methyltransferase n=1 Tax=Pseudidiomarina maritima TaxID=519453 RepID=A0A1I6HLT0_9GAMM|nr:16S rRNA (cytosine(967)-C(5))-methyltransferase RsmB [Pseudidiomarina maritima]SFR55433.1 16S rRNA m(5)C-967 methyltransferase [Pseudidiomarina maritima]